MTSVLLENVRALRPGQGVVASSVLIEGGRIAALNPTAPSADAIRIQGDGRLLTPGLIDVHIHGVGHHLFEAGPDDLVAGLERLSQYGVTSVLPTLYRVMDEASWPLLAQLAEALDRVESVRVPGFHLEGPFLALPGAGAATVPGDVGLLDRLFEATGERIAAMSVSPEVPGILSVIERLVDRGAVVFLTHTGASVEATQAAIAAGARHATHFYNVFPPPGESEPGVRRCGVVEAVLADEKTSVDFILDGVHVDPVAVQMALRAKGPSRVALITDANVGAGLPAGEYATPWGFTVRVREGDAARVHDPGTPRDGTLAGSALTMDRAVGNALAWLGLPEADVWAMATIAPARLLGRAGAGDLRVGSDADLVLWDQREGLVAQRVWVGGRMVHQVQKTTEALL